MKQFAHSTYASVEGVDRVVVTKFRQLCFSRFTGGPELILVFVTDVIWRHALRSKNKILGLVMDSWSKFINKIKLAELS